MHHVVVLPLMLVHPEINSNSSTKEHLFTLAPPISLQTVRFW